ncbi:Bug1p [Saccharomyces paradoxus]|uniref:Bug1p n=1 Tax=Saccharomyces paradoxus TaxID=27291 RepID=A0A8B8UND9_SACPA|nr:Bug1 [Saccharomyces paradoxus]QHS72139.1 Bug1 [Saccharomyces paradoxus]
MSEQESDELKRMKQLEEARKRVEELKKKKNKKSKGKKNKNSNATGSIGSETPDLESTPAEELAHEQTVEVDLTKSENNDQDAEGNKENEEAEEKEIGQVKSNNSATQEKETEEGNSTFANVEEDSAENTSKGEVQGAVGSSNFEQAADVEKIIEPQEEKKTIQPQEEREPSNSPATTDDLFANDDNQESDFLTTIEKKKEEDELIKLRAENEKLTQENKQLKFLNMENETTVDDLQDQLQEKEDIINSLQNDLQTTKDELIATLQRLKEAETKSARNATTTPIQFADFNTSSNNLTPSQSVNNSGTQMTRENNMEVDRLMLDKWRQWNVDMTTWRSIGSGPIMEF